MLFEDKKQAAVRILAGGSLGVAALILLCTLFDAFSLSGGGQFRGLCFTIHLTSRPLWLDTLVSYLLWFAFGAELGIATLPLGDTGETVLIRSLLHFAAMAATVVAWTCYMVGGDAVFILVPLALLYLVIWLGRWVGWCAEAEQLREKLGLTAGPSPLKWRETLPHIGFAALLCLVLPLVLRLCDAYDVPVLSGIFYPWLLLPIGGFCSAFSLGRRQGFCPLYPLACAVFILLFIPLARLFSNMDDWPLLWLALAFPLVGNAVGALFRAWKEEEHHEA